MLVADLVAQALAAEEVDFIVGFPENRVLDSAATASIRPIITRTEKVAVNVADGYARMLSGAKPGVCAVQDGPGAEAAFGGLAQAYGDRSPVLVLCGDFDRSAQGIEPNFDAPHALAQVARWTAAVDSVDGIAPTLHSGFARLRAGRGPVAIAIARDLMYEQVTGLAPRYTTTRAFRSEGDPGDVEELAVALRRAGRPVIVAGQGVLYAEATSELIAAAVELAAPVMTTLNGKSAFPEDHALALGTAGRSRPDMVSHFLQSADLILGVGTSFTRSDYITEMPSGTALAQITHSPSDIGKCYPVVAGAVGDAKLVLGQLLACVKHHRPNETRSCSTVAREIATVKDRYLCRWRQRLESTDTPISPYRVISELNRALDKARTVLTHDSGNPRDQLTAFYETTTPHGYIGWGKTTHLGTGLGLALGAKLAAPDWTAVNVMGDAALGMVGMDLETGVRERLPIVTVVMNNGVMGGYGAHMPNAVRLHRSNELSGDYRGVADALGLHSESVRDPADLSASLKRCIDQSKRGKSALLEVVTCEEPDVPR
jgi:acetolactate synthase-1/2/3 large subunit